MHERECTYCEKRSVYVVFCNERTYIAPISVEGNTMVEKAREIGSPTHVGDDEYLCEDHKSEAD